MKKILLSMLLLFAGLAAKAQTTLVATLLNEHGNHVATYYGAGALKEAYNAAEHGYTIVLSPGQFDSNMTLSKLITIRGAGMCTVTEKNVQPTILNGTITFAYSHSDDMYSLWPDYHLTMEGVRVCDAVLFTNNTGLKDAQFTKCTFARFYRSGADAYGWKNVSFVDCYMLDETYLPSGSTVSFYNCVVKLIKAKENNTTVYMENCVAKLNGNGSDGVGIKQGMLVNCFLLNKQKGYAEPTEACVCEHCFSTQPTFFINQTNDTNTVVEREVSEVFRKFDGENWTDAYDFYKLNDWAIYDLLGYDGSQMGIYGGAAPFSPITSAPQITSFSAPESTSNGILRVNIKVEVPQ